MVSHKKNIIKRQLTAGACEAAIGKALTLEGF